MKVVNELYVPDAEGHELIIRTMDAIIFPMASLFIDLKRPSYDCRSPVDYASLLEGSYY